MTGATGCSITRGDPCLTDWHVVVQSGRSSPKSAFSQSRFWFGPWCMRGCLYVRTLSNRHHYHSRHQCHLQTTLVKMCPDHNYEMRPAAFCY